MKRFIIDDQMRYTMNQKDTIIMEIIGMKFIYVLSVKFKIKNGAY